MHMPPPRRRRALTMPDPEGGRIPRGSVHRLLVHTLVGFREKPPDHSRILARIEELAGSSKRKPTRRKKRR